jgi:hypothetical protein
MAMKNNNGAQVYVFLHNTSSTHMKMPPNVGQRPEQGTWIIENNLSIGPAGTKLLLAEYAAGTASVDHVIGHNAYNAGASNAPCQVSEQRFDSLEQMREKSGYEAGSIFVDGYAVFMNAAEPPHAKGGTTLVPPDAVDLRLKPAAKTVDAGVVIKGINDGFAGAAPDIGAYESGRPLPVYGPRSALVPRSSRQ